jgi:hypothetical protein
MTTSLRRQLSFLGVAAVLAGTAVLAQTPPSHTADAKTPLAAREEPIKNPVLPTAGPTTPPSEKKSGTTDVPSLDALKLPSGTIFVLYEEIKDTLRLIPKIVLMTPEENQRREELIERLKRQVKPEKPEVPSSCKLTGQVDGDVVRLRARFDFRTERANTWINLGCQRAWPIDAKLDGQLPWLQVGEEGFLVQAEKPGGHQVVLDLVLPWMPNKGAKRTERGFDLDLPRAAITVLEQLDLPGTVVEVHVGDRLERTKPVAPEICRLENVAIGPQDHLELTWKGPAAEPATREPVLSAVGHLKVHMEETPVLTEVELKLEVLHQETAQWKLWLPLPPGAELGEVKLQPKDDPRIQAIERPTDRQNPILTIRLKEPSSKPLQVNLQIRQPRQGNSVSIGPVVVQGAHVQRGDIEIHAVEDQHVRYKEVRPGVHQKEVTDEQLRENVRAVFAYWNIPAPAKPATPYAHFLTVQVEPAKGLVEARTVHSLTLVEGDPPHWQISTRIDVTPHRTAVDSLEVSLPPDYEFDKANGATLADTVDEVVLDPRKKSAQIKLTRKQFRPFSVTLLGSYPPVPEDRQKPYLELPQPTQWSVARGLQDERLQAGVQDRGGEVHVAQPKGRELVTPQGRGEPETLVQAIFHQLFLASRIRPGTRGYTWATERAPDRVELTWRTHRPEMPVQGEAHVTLAGRQVRVRHVLRFQFAPLPPNQVTLRIPAVLRDRVRVIDGGTLTARQVNNRTEWSVVFKGPVLREHNLILEYSLVLAEPDAEEEEPEPVRLNTPDGSRPSRAAPRRFSVPLIQPVQATQGETKVYVWSGPTDQVSLAGGSWTELPTEAVPERPDSLPALVLRGGLDSSLPLRAAPAAKSLATAIVERILVRAVVAEEGNQTYRVRFLLNKLNARHLDLSLPVPLASTNLAIRLAGREPSALHLVDETGREVDVGRVVRMRVDPDLYHKPVILDVSYQVDSGRTSGNSLWQSLLQPPALLDSVLLGRVRWHVELPAGWMPLYARGGYTAEVRWGWRGWLFTPIPAPTSGNLEQWLTGMDGAVTAASEPSLVCWHTNLGTLPLVHVPQRYWLLACSLIFLTLGLGLLFTPMPRVLFWSCVTACGLVVALIGIFWPSTVPAVVYGCEPGVLVLVLVMGIQWMLYQRYRRQVVFMPGFKRVKQGSSLVRGGSNQAREPSTVDEQPKRGNAISPKMGSESS